MSKALLRALLLVLAVVVAFSPETTLGRGPGGGAGGARGAGGPGGRGRQPSKPSGAKKGELNAKRPHGLGNIGANDNLAGGQKLTGGLQKLGGKFDKFAPGPGRPQRAALGQEKIQSLNTPSGQQRLARDGQHQATAQDAINNLQNGPRPFSAPWYAEHPNAWQATHPHADAWAAATATGVAAWLGWTAYGDTPTYGGSYSTTYVYEQPSDDSDNSSADESDATDDNQSNADGDEDEWLALGTYSVQSDSGEPTSRYFQLSTNRQGELRGVYYDEISGNSQNLSGTIDESSHVATWSLDANRATTFRANLSDLTQATGSVAVTQASGEQQWRIAREQNST